MGPLRVRCSSHLGQPGCHPFSPLASVLPCQWPWYSPLHPHSSSKHHNQSLLGSSGSGAGGWEAGMGQLASPANCSWRALHGLRAHHMHSRRSLGLTFSGHGKQTGVHSSRREACFGHHMRLGAKAGADGFIQSNGEQTLVRKGRSGSCEWVFFHPGEGPRWGGGSDWDSFRNWSHRPCWWTGCGEWGAPWYLAWCHFPGWGRSRLGETPRAALHVVQLREQ